MFKPHYGQCTHPGHEHGDNCLIVIKKGWCERCNHEEKQKAKKNRLSGALRSKPGKKPTGEAALFFAIWNTRKRVCSCCKVPLGPDAKASFFSHLLAKGAYPKFRLVDKNIWLVCEQCHNEWETGDRNQPKFKDKLRTQQILKREYYGNDITGQGIPEAEL